MRNAKFIYPLTRRSNRYDTLSYEECHLPDIECPNPPMWFIIPKDAKMEGL